MEKCYKIFKRISKEVHTPSDNYYARYGDSQVSNIEIFSIFDEEFETEDKALTHLVKMDYNKWNTGEYIILPVFKK